MREKKQLVALSLSLSFPLTLPPSLSSSFSFFLSLSPPFLPSSLILTILGWLYVHSEMVERVQRYPIQPLLPQIHNLPYYQSPVPAWVDTVFMFIFTGEEGKAPRSLGSYLKSHS